MAKEGWSCVPPQKIKKSFCNSSKDIFPLSSVREHYNYMAVPMGQLNNVCGHPRSALAYGHSAITRIIDIFVGSLDHDTYLSDTFEPDKYLMYSANTTVRRTMKIFYSNPDEVVVPQETVAWAEAWVVVYAITSWESFRVAVRAVEAVTAAMPHQGASGAGAGSGGACGGGDHVAATPTPVLIMANKKDLEHIRQVPEAEGRKLSNQYGCKFVEVSAAEMVSQVNESIDGLLRQISQLKGQTSPRLRKLSVSKMFNQLMNRSSGSSSSSSSEHRPLMPRVSLRDRSRKRGHIRHNL
ncbi:unnamed protein product, partial [Meganyctiphanes norvegica]